MFDIETARELAAELDSKSAQVIHGLINELKASHQREAALEEGLLDLQLRLSVVMTKLKPDEMDEQQRVIDELFEYTLHRDRITDGLIDTKGVEKDGLITDGTV